MSHVLFNLIAQFVAVPQLGLELAWFKSKAAYTEPRLSNVQDQVHCHSDLFRTHLEHLFRIPISQNLERYLL